MYRNFTIYDNPDSGCQVILLQPCFTFMDFANWFIMHKSFLYKISCVLRKKYTAKIVFLVYNFQEVFFLHIKIYNAEENIYVFDSN